MITENIDITHRHTFGIPTQARYWGEYNSIDELRTILREVQEKNIDYMPIGQGSNLLFLRQYNGLLLHSTIRYIHVVEENDDHVWVEAGSGVVWDDFVAYCVAKGWGGIENLSYIPGEVGAGAVQNIGAYGMEVSDSIVYVDALDTATLQQRRFENRECEYGYRTSIFKGSSLGKYIVTSVTYRLDKVPHYKLDYGNLQHRVGDNPALQTIRDAIIEIRREKLPEPKLLGSAGSFFVNPVIPRKHYEELLQKYPDMPCYKVDEGRVKVPAGWLIDKQGWKGKTRGGAMIYPQQSLVIVNTGNAVAADVVQLANDVAFSVMEAYGIVIRPEVNYIF